MSALKKQDQIILDNVKLMVEAAYSQLRVVVQNKQLDLHPILVDKIRLLADDIEAAAKMFLTEKGIDYGKV